MDKTLVFHLKYQQENNQRVYHLVFLLRYSLLIGSPTKASAHLYRVDIFLESSYLSYLFNFPPYPEEVEASEFLEVKKSPVSRSIEGGEKVCIL